MKTILVPINIITKEFKMIIRFLFRFKFIRTKWPLSINVLRDFYGIEL